MQKSTLISRRRLQFERLESRQMMAGNVTAAIAESGNLEIKGDSNNNIVAVTQFNSGEWKVQGLLGTTINGKSSEKFTYRGGMDVSLGRGNDGFAIVKGNLEGELSVRTSNGIDGVVLTRLTAYSIYVHTGSETDAVLVAKVSVQGPEMPPEGETETASLLQSSYGTATFQTSSGDDYVLLAKLTAQNVIVSTSSGRDVVGLLGVSASESIQVNLGSGNLDILGIVKSNAPLANLNGGGNAADTYIYAKNSFPSQNATGFQHTQSFDAYATQVETLVQSYLPLIEKLPGLKGLPDFHL